MFGFFKKKNITRQVTLDAGIENLYNSYFSAERDAAVQASLNFYEGPIKDLPLCLYEGTTKVQRSRLDSFFARPSKQWDRGFFWSQAIRQLLLYGQTFFEILPEGKLFLFYGKYACTVINPDGQLNYNPNAQIYFQANNRFLFPDQVVWCREPGPIVWRGQGRADCLNQELEACRQAGLRILTQDFSPKVFLKNLLEETGSTAIKKFSQNVKKFLSGSGLDVLKLRKNAEISNLKIDYSTEHYLAFRKMLWQNVYQLFGIPLSLVNPDKIGPYLSGSENYNLFLKNSFNPVLSSITIPLSDALLFPDERARGLKIDFDYSQLSKSVQSELIKGIALLSGQHPVASPDELRGMIGLPPIAGGSELPQTGGAQ